jgi:CheY-like chemotaxis protein
MNLCVNARDAMAEGGDLTIAAENMPVVAQPPRPPEQAQPGPYILITVRDTGCGIRADVLDRIFEPFFTTKGVGQGTGLGLSTALGIVRSHKGFITVESEPGRGSAFRVYLPAVPEALVARAGVPARAKPAAGRNETILVVDDEPSILITVRHSLEGAGYRVLTAADGREALGLFQEHAGLIRLVVTDVMMPVMDGLKLARALRQCDGGIRVIACSGLDRDLKSTELEEGIIVDFLSKPYERAALLAAVRRQLVAEPA